MSTKPTIVLVHGFWGGAAHWSKMIIELSRKGVFGGSCGGNAADLTG
ncbi:hypothetical protein [Serratia ureilytica]|nr:hypothetical protein [Serratia ureilytica]MCC4105239.1 hypothetical protein [Serratia ureilytica]